LSLQNLEIVTVIGLALTRIALLDRLGNMFPDRASPASIRILPGKAIMFSWCADNALCVLVHLVIIMFFQSIFVLSFHVATADLDGVKFVGTDAPE
jgi:hypothetical protein